MNNTTRDIADEAFLSEIKLNIRVINICTIVTFIEAELKIGSFQLIGGAVFTSPSVATSGVITSIADVSVVTCCLKCTGISHCTGVFYDGTSAVCQPYHFDNYTSLNIEGKENFVHIVPGAHRISIRFFSTYSILNRYLHVHVYDFHFISFGYDKIDL